jgi:adenylyltransferase/sulfurtransferase
VGTEGRVMTVRPGITPCLACIYPEQPGTGELATCDTVGVLGPAIAVVAGYQAAAILKLLSGHAEATDTGLLTIDFWKNRHRTIDTGKPREGCICCDQRKFVHLDRPMESSTAALCGRNSIQVRPASVSLINLQQLAEKFQAFGRTESSAHLLRVHLKDESGIVLTVFPDGRCIVAGTTDLGRARSLVSKYIGS